MNRSGTRPQGGFTLLELMVAVAILAVLGVTAYAGLDAAYRTQARLKEEDARWRALALLWLRLEDDLRAWVPRPVRARGGQPQAAWLAEPQVHAAYGAQLEMTRLTDAAAGEGPPVRVGYRLREGRVEGLRWPVLDAGPRAEPQVAVLLTGVRVFDLAYLDAQGVWHTRWPPAPEAGRPRAVRVSLSLEDGRVFHRLFAF
ncbi:MAG: type II secretion system minor pseudopilin GspJ [Thiobacillaceae bacterium]|nr:type II secretion system minor pseudopilin GspJ [Thiobacillaceae bacterium]MDW8323385.1 type II secretion system minor pseudopilin GspJ [Burkholderiales bacterium]